MQTPVTPDLTEPGPPPKLDLAKPFVFVSYAHADADLVAPVMQRIAELGWQVFYDADIQLGQDWNQSLAEAVAACTGFIVMMTSNAIASSHVNHELNFASNKGKSILAVYLEPTQLSVTLSWLLDQNQQLFKWQMNDETYARYLKGFLDNLDVRRTEPLPPGPTLVVDPTGQQGYKRIALALEAAEPNSRILVKPGVYREQLVIDKPIELVGEDGARRNTVIQVKRGHVVTFRAATGRVANLTLRQSGSPRKGRWAGIAIEAGAPVLEGVRHHEQQRAGRRGVGPGGAAGAQQHHPGRQSRDRGRRRPGHAHRGQRDHPQLVRHGAAFQRPGDDPGQPGPR